MKNFNLVISLLFLVVAWSCQDESETVTQNPAATLTAASPLTNLVSRVAQEPTYYDNCIDGSSCFCVLLPVSATADGHQFTVSYYSDYTAVKAILNESAYDDDVIHFNFPITIKYRNYQEVAVNSQEQLNALRANCHDDGNDHEINCIDFNFPIVVNTYDTTTQVPTSITIQSNTQFFNLIAGLSATQFYSLVYPISMTNTNGETTVFHNNAELQAGIQAAVNYCVDDNGSGNTDFSNTVITGTWHISSFVDESQDLTTNYSGDTFTFNTGGVTTALVATNSVNGVWSNTTDDGYQKFNLNYTGTALHELNKDWRILDYSSTVIHLKHSSEGGGDAHTLTFTKN